MKTVFLLLFLAIVDCRKSYDHYQVWRMKPKSGEIRGRVVQQLQNYVDFWTDPTIDNSHIDFLVSPRNTINVTRFLAQNQVPHSVIMRNVQEMIERENGESNLNEVLKNDDCDSIMYSRKKSVSKRGIWDSIVSSFFPRYSTTTTTSAGSTTKERVRVPRKIVETEEGNEPKKLFFPNMDWRQYHRLETIYQYLRHLQRSFPEVVELIDIGRSGEGRPLLMLKVGKKRNHRKPAIFIEGGIHAREWISPATVTFILRALVENYEQNSDIVDVFDFYVLPVANPDG